ncbi:hypothetical protein CDAR_583901, partial [Caerostris darwini]
QTMVSSFVRQQADLGMGTKHADVDPQMKEQNNQCSPFILVIEKEA